jgi:hypothetical protein
MSYVPEPGPRDEQRALRVEENATSSRATTAGEIWDKIAFRLALEPAATCERVHPAGPVADMEPSRIRNRSRPPACHSLA